MQEHRIQEVVEQAARLRAGLVRTARDLHDACQDVALQNDLLAVNRRGPSAIDHRTTAKRWSALADQALAAAEAWSEDRDPPSPLNCPGCTGPLPWGTLLAAGSVSTSPRLQCPACGAFACLQAVPVEAFARPRRPSGGSANSLQDPTSVVDALDEIVACRLFTVGLRLSGALPWTDGELRSRLESAVRDIDGCIGDVRRLSLHLTLRGSGPAAAGVP